MELLEDLEQNRGLERRKRGTEESDCSLVEAKQHLLKRNCSGMTISHFRFTIFFYIVILCFLLIFGFLFWCLNVLSMFPILFIWSLFHLCVLHDSYATVHVLRSFRPSHQLLKLIDNPWNRVIFNGYFALFIIVASLFHPLWISLLLTSFWESWVLLSWFQKSWIGFSHLSNVLLIIFQRALKVSVMWVFVLLKSQHHMQDNASAYHSFAHKKGSYLELASSTTKTAVEMDDIVESVRKRGSKAPLKLFLY